MKKKILTALIVLVMVLSVCATIVACGGKTIKVIDNGSIVAEGTFEKGVGLESTKLESTDENYISTMNKIADKEFDDEKVAVYDISLVKDNAKVQPDGKVKITMNAPFESENGYTTYHIKGETVEALETTVSDGKISFETSSFSYFVVVGNNPIDPNPNDPDKNFFAFADEFEQGTLTVDGTDVKKGGLGLTLTEGQQVELVARAGNGYKLLGWYKNSKSSGSDEKYEDLNVNPATFTYTGTEKVYIHARFSAIEYGIYVNLSGGMFKEGETIPSTYNVESEKIVLPTPENGGIEFLGWYDANGNKVTQIAKGSTGDLELTAKWQEPTYLRVNYDKTPNENGDYVLFGSYPQTAVKRDTTTILALNKLAGDLPENGNNRNWTSYRYSYAKIIEGDKTETTNEIDFMWYIDVEYKGETYRGVYFNYYRPNAVQGPFNTLVDGSGTDSRIQKTNKYYVDNTYWFKVEPILWKILRQEDGKAQLLCMSTLDAQPYTQLTRKSSEKIEDELDSHYVYFNASENVPENTFANNYEYSTIRAWLNNDFFESAFDADEQALVCDTTLDNVSAELGNNTIDKVYIPSLADVENLGSYYIKASDYSQAQGVGTDYSNSWSYSWYIRENYYVLKYNDKSTLTSYDSTRYRDVVSATNGNLLNPISKNYAFTGVGSIYGGVVACLLMTL